ncbi:uncharacterized protein LOC121530418 [Drosophila eugracilis]|uniref:uncharacterized protein LOC121530418 n=1 Tax=Drosophila eugracilis TaxID=29029 RepID=UPI001BD9FFFE|nr:uncharacterized protein LOC121530418 [Drosophila eugracilis]
MNLQQRKKTANQYTQEVEQMAKALEGAYISDGLSLELGRNYSTRHAVKAMTKNCTIDKRGGTADVETSEETIVVVIIITTATAVPTITVMDEADIEETKRPWQLESRPK